MILDKLGPLADEVRGGADFRTFVLARAVQLAQSDGNPSVAIKALELIARLALGDRPPPVGGDDDFSLDGLTDDEMMEARRRAQKLLDEVSGNGTGHITAGE